MSTFLTGLAEAFHAGRARGVTSVCSSHPIVIRAALRRAARDGGEVLIEATCNQVNQFGGYTGMQPADFVRFVQGIAAEEGLPADRIAFGGDHLGPNPWKAEAPEAAMEKAEAMVAAYVAAGFRKIHLDASMGCLAEPVALDDETTAHRAARLAARAEAVAREAGLPVPLYIIGTEVPVPGGADHVLSEVEPTAPEAARHTIAVHRSIFAEKGLSDVFDRVLGIVVQPGVEFGSENVIAYRPEKARALNGVLSEEPGLVFEAHSTDYQTQGALAALVRDGYAILKVGPGLTFALREALYGLDLIAGELDPTYGERPLRAAMERLMLDEPKDWKGHYHGDEAEKALQRHYSYSDRIRYYWNRPQAEAAVGRLRAALEGRPIPETLMRQFLPQVDPALGQNEDVDALLVAAVDRELATYAAACEPSVR